MNGGVGHPDFGQEYVFGVRVVVGTNRLEDAANNFEEGT